LLGTAADRVVVGIGMVPRGEVGLIFAGIGSGLIVDGSPVIDQAVFSAVVVMVMVTTVLTPPALTWAFARAERLALPPAPAGPGR
jgi:Kef-type K+ transport system membrane component KefB